MASNIELADKLLKYLLTEDAKTQQSDIAKVLGVSVYLVGEAIDEIIYRFPNRFTLVEYGYGKSYYSIYINRDARSEVQKFIDYGGFAKEAEAELQSESPNAPPAGWLSKIGGYTKKVFVYLWDKIVLVLLLGLLGSWLNGCFPKFPSPWENNLNSRDTAEKPHKEAPNNIK